MYNTYEFYSVLGILLGVVTAVSKNDAINKYMWNYGEPYGYIVVKGGREQISRLHFIVVGAASARKIIPHAMAICQEENSKNFLEKFEKMG